MKTWHFVLQWHVTAQCDLRCAHCYMYDEPGYISEIQDPLSTEECLHVIDNFVGMLERLSKEHSVEILPRINFTGGDPMLRQDLFELLDYAKERDIYVGMLANPNHITPASARKLKEHGVMRYQISIDGMEQTHDASRRKGSFRDSLRALKVLKEVGILENVMFSLSKENADDLVPVMRLMAEREVRRFDFARVAAYGNARESGNGLEPLEYRGLLLRAYETMKELQGQGVKTAYGFKDHLWNLLRFELGDYKPWGHGESRKIYDGCHAGQTFMVLLADGTIYACRRFVSPLGNVRSDDLYQIFRHSPTLNKMRNIQLYEKCRLCELLQYCRGCPAVAAGANEGDYLSPDPQCWKEV